jgi:hypothetical protein
MLLLLLPAAIVAATPTISAQPWFQICCGSKSAKFGQLFTNDTAWPTLKQHTDSIKFFIGSIKTLPNVVPGGYTAVASFFNRTGMAVDVEAGGLRGFNCNGASYAKQTLDMIEPLLAVGVGASASVLRITFDGPFAHSLHQDTKLCPLTPQQVAQELVHNIDTTRQLVSARYPNLKVLFNWNEPIPWYRVGRYPAFHNGTVKDFGDMLDILKLVTSAGVDFDAFHADSPYEYNQDPQGGYPKLGALMAAVRAEGLKFGHYFNNVPHEVGDFEQGTLADVREFVAAIGNPDHAIIESWYKYPHAALPEDEQNTFAHTAKAAWELFQ